MGSSGHRQIDHTADLAFELWAPSEAELLREGARAVMAVLTGGVDPTATGTRTVELESLDREDRLVRWLNEVLYLATVDGFLTAGAELTLHDAGLRATIAGEVDGLRRIVTEVKSATYHDLVLERRGDAWYARVVLDV